MYKNQPYYVKNNNFFTQKRVSTMIYYLFPRTTLFINSICNIIYREYHPCVNYSQSLFYYQKELLDKMENKEKWDVICKQTHVYSNLNKASKMNESSTFYDLMEIRDILMINFDGVSELFSLHFQNMSISFVKRIRNTCNKDHICVFDKEYIHQNFPNRTSQTFHFTYCHSNKTNEYENTIELLLQMCIMLCLQKKGSVCIINMKDTFTSLSLQLIIFVSYFFEKSYFLKPTSNLPTSSEKYFVCKGFMYDNIGNKMYSTILKLYNDILLSPSNCHIISIINYNVPLFVINKIEEINSIFGQSRLEHIHNIMNNLENPEWDYENKEIEKCNEWCGKFLKSPK
jgi:hypothetical protein